MSIENAVIEVLSTGEFDDLPPDIEDWDEVHAKYLEYRIMKSGVHFEYTFYREDDIRAQVKETLASRHSEKINASGVES